MNKVICDVCGTAYPETANQCPICGSAKVSADHTAAVDNTAAEESGYTYVPGGRFSKQNVRRRNKSAGVRQERHSAPEVDEQDNEEGANKGLIAVVIVLLVAILAVAIYLVVNFFNPNMGNAPTLPTTSQSATNTPTGDGLNQGTPCTALDLSNKTIEFRASGMDWLLIPKPTPEDTTDVVTFASSDETVATVSADGRITAVGAGMTEITVTCGNITAECRVICNFATETPTEEPTEEPTEAPTQAPTQAPDTPANPVAGNFVFRWAEFDEESGMFDATIRISGDPWAATPKGVNAADVQWSVDDTSICTVDANGVVTAVKTGKTILRAVYNGETYLCIVRVAK